MPKKRALKLGRDTFTRKIGEAVKGENIDQRETLNSNHAVDRTGQAVEYGVDKFIGSVKAGTQKAKIAIQKRQNFIKERRAQAAEKKAQAADSVRREQGIAEAGAQQEILTPPMNDRVQIHTGIEPATSDQILEIPYSISARPAPSGETALKGKVSFPSLSTKSSGTQTHPSIYQSSQPTKGEAGRSAVRERFSENISPKEKPMRGPSAIKSRRPEESVKAMAEPIKTGRAGASKPHFPTKSANSIRTGRFTSPRMSAGKALMERAARRMKLHSQKQLVKQTSCAVKAAGTVTKKAAAVTVKVARSLMSAVIGLIGGAGFFVLLAVILLGGALSAFGSSPGSGSYTPVSAEVEAFDPIIRIYATQHGIPEYVDLIKAVMMQESGGSVELVGGDVMQCAEGMGLPVGTPVDPEKSIDFGTSIIADNLRLAGATGPGDIPHISLALQGYNFGNGYISWALARGGYSKENAREFSIQQAAAHGWSGYGDMDYVEHVLRYYPLAANPLDGASAIAEGRFAFPFPGHTWDTYPGHNGIDISFANCYGEPVYACAPGTVRYIQDGWTPAHGVDNMWSFGNCVVVDHTDGWQSVYAHLSRLAVVPGTPVRQGQLVGYIGSTGNSTGPHLHLALYYHGSAGENGMNYAEMAWPQYRD